MKQKTDKFIEKEKIDEITKFLTTKKISGLILIGFEETGLFTTIHLNSYKQIPELSLILETLSSNMKNDFIERTNDILIPMNNKKGKMVKEVKQKQNYIG